MSVPRQSLVRFGSFHGRLHSARQAYVDALALVFGVGLHPMAPEPDATCRFELTVTDCPAQPTNPSLPEEHLNRLILGGTPDCPTIATEALHAQIRFDRHPVDIRLTVLQPDLAFPALCVHFGVIVHKVLFYCDRLMLHAAAVQLDETACLFVGDKGAGKSTSTLALARAGGIVLGEDQIALWASSGGFLVSGNDERSRVTERTERHFFDAPLPIEPRDFAGTMKKEVRIGDYFRSAPFRDVPPGRLLFPRVTGEFSLTRISAQTALLRMLAYNGHFQRFAGAADQTAFLDFLARFITTVPCWDLTLSENLHDLNSLADQLRNG